MANYDNRGGGNRFGGGSGRPAFKKSWGNARADDRPVTFHKATCAECGKMCEVPFRPIQGKPVYCKDCFDKRGGNMGGKRGENEGNRFPKKDFDPRNSGKPVLQNNTSYDGLYKQLEAVNTKLERLISAVEALNPKKSIEEKKEVKETRNSSTKERSKKKASKK